MFKAVKVQRERWCIYVTHPSAQTSQVRDTLARQKKIHLTQTVQSGNYALRSYIVFLTFI